MRATGMTNRTLYGREDSPMFIKGTDHYLQATKEGAVVQALKFAAESDRLHRRNEEWRGHRLIVRAIRGGVITLWRLLSHPAWALGIVILAIVLGMNLFSE